MTSAAEASRAVLWPDIDANEFVIPVELMMRMLVVATKVMNGNK